MEKWKDIPGYEGYYMVSSLGNVKSLERKVVLKNGKLRTIKELVLKPGLAKKGYKTVSLSKNYKQKTFCVHQLVAMAFLKHKPMGHLIVVDHKNEIKTDNRLENLQLLSNRENCSKNKKGLTSKLLGVYKKKGKKKWTSALHVNGSTKYLGVFNTEIEAHQAYKDELKQL